MSPISPFETFLIRHVRIKLRILHIYISFASGEQNFLFFPALRTYTCEIRHKVLSPTHSSSYFVLLQNNRQLTQCPDTQEDYSVWHFCTPTPPSGGGRQSKPICARFFFGRFILRSFEDFADIVDLT